MRHLFRRAFATVVEGTHARGALRPHLGFSTPETHPLWAFFRRDQNNQPVVVDEDTAHFTLNGRSWSAEELRRKSFADLHTLWYVVLRERNLLRTQVREARRMHFYQESWQSIIGNKDRECRKTMARIKHVLNERRMAHLEALELMKPQNQRRDIHQLSKLQTLAPRTATPATEARPS